MLSVLENNHFPIHFHLLVSGSESYDFSIFNHLETINPNYAVTVYHLNTEYFTTLQTNGYFTIAMYYRMCIPAILGDISDTTLYLDTDVLCLGDISELFTIDLTGQLSLQLLILYFEHISTNYIYLDFKVQTPISIRAYFCSTTNIGTNRQFITF